METDPIRQIAIFRVPDLQACLTQLRLSRTGLKRDLQTRLGTHLRVLIASVELSADPFTRKKKDDAVGVVNRVYCRLKGIPDTGAMPGVEVIETPGYLPNETGFVAERSSQGASRSAGGSSRENSQIRCICGQSHDKGTMIQCEDCGVWQHCECVRVDVHAATRVHFLCELCRLAKADPFWRRVGQPLVPPMKLQPVQPPRMSFDGRPIEEDVVQVVDRHFQVQHAQLDPVRRHSGSNQLQVACLMMGDSVPLRVHWPRNTDLRMNNMMYKPYGRSTNAKLGANSRDDMASVGIMVTPGRNRLHLSALDKEHYCVTVHLAQQRSECEVRDMMHAPETVQEALKRVQAGSVKGDPNDSDDDMVLGSIEFTLRCPLTGSRIKTPARFAGVPGLTAFDLDAFMGMVKRSKKWQCPHSMRNLPVQDLMCDGYLSRILPRLQNLPDVMDLEVSPASGEWRISGSQGAWLSIHDNPSRPLDASAVIKAEPQLGSAPVQAAAGGDSDSEEELSEGEELRRIAAAVAADRRARALAAAPQDDIIVLSDSDDDQTPAAPAPPQPPALPQPAAPGPSHTPAARMGTHQLIRLNQALPHGPRPVPATLQPGAGHASAFRPPSLQQSQAGQSSTRMTPATAQAQSTAEGSAESIPGIGPAQVIQRRGVTIRLPTRPKDSSPATGSQEQSQQPHSQLQLQQPTQQSRALPRSMAGQAAIRPIHVPAHLQHQQPYSPQWSTTPSPGQAPWHGYQPQTAPGILQPSPYQPPPPPPSAAMRPLSPGPPAYTNARPIAQPLRFGAPPMPPQGSPQYSSIPQNPTASPLVRMPVQASSQGAPALEQRFGMRAGQSQPMPRAPSPVPFEFGDHEPLDQVPAGAALDGTMEYNDWLNMLLAGGPDDQSGLQAQTQQGQQAPAPPSPPPSAAETQPPLRGPSSPGDVVDLDTSSSG